MFLGTIAAAATATATTTTTTTTTTKKNMKQMFCSLLLTPQRLGPTDRRLYSSRSDCLLCTVSTEAHYAVISSPAVAMFYRIFTVVIYIHFYLFFPLYKYLFELVRGTIL
jgi:hypothetical protein